MKNRYRVCLPQLQSPTYYNVCQNLQNKGWTHTRFKWLSHFNENHFKFNTAAAESLEFKHLLAQLVTQYCPNVMPETFCINDLNWASVLNDVANKYYLKTNYSADQVDNLVWILKPALLNNGQHIKIFHQFSQLERHYLGSNRLGGEHVLQQYITQPHLLKGHKYSIRMFVVITNNAGAYIYPHGYFNVAQHPFQPDEFNNLEPHITNEHLHEGESNVVQIPTQRFDFFEPIYQQIKTIVSATITGLRQQHPQAFIAEKQRKLAVLGFDFLVDSEMRVWLLEANHGPCFPTSNDHPLQAYLYSDFWQAFIESFVLPIAKKLPAPQIQYHMFEWVDIL